MPVSAYFYSQSDDIRVKDYMSSLGIKKKDYTIEISPDDLAYHLMYTSESYSYNMTLKNSDTIGMDRTLRIYPEGRDPEMKALLKKEAAEAAAKKNAQTSSSAATSGTAAGTTTVPATEGEKAA
jgi:hypothetical protein